MQNNIKAGNGSTNVVSGANVVSSSRAADNGAVVATAQLSYPVKLSFVASAGPTAAASNAAGKQSKRLLFARPVWWKDDKSPAPWIQPPPPGFTRR